MAVWTPYSLQPSQAFAEKHAFDNAPDTSPLLGKFVPTPTAEDFIMAAAEGDITEMRLLILMGSRGEGKTTTGIYACQTVAQALVQTGQAHLLPVRVAVIRDTWVNLERTTIASFEENARNGLHVEWKNGRHEAITYEGGLAMCHFFFFGMDNREDADKVQGFQCGILWLEEVAPAADLAAGMPPETLGLGGTCLRQKGIPKRIFVTMNPPDDEHWIMSVEETLANLDLEEIVVKRFNIRPREKSDHFRAMATAWGTTAEESAAWTRAAEEFEAYTRTNEVLLEAINRGDLVSRLVKGEVGGVTIGEAVVSEFSFSEHTTNEWTPPIPGVDIIRCWDAGLTPSTVWMQATPAGNVNIFGSRLSVNKGMGQHILEQVVPFQEKHGIVGLRSTYERGKKGFRFRDIGDPALDKGNEGTKAEETARWTLENMLGANFEAGPVAWSARRQAIKLAFYRASNSGDKKRRLVRLYRPECTGRQGPPYLVKALNGRAHYPTDPRTGRITETVEAAKKASGLYFQEIDALAYGFAVIMPAEDWVKPPPQVRTGRQRMPRSWVGV